MFKLLLRVLFSRRARFDADAIKQQDLERSRYERLAAEIDVVKAKGK